MLITKTKKLEISIITVSCNSEKTIKITLNSVRDQTYKKIEHIIIDGNSVDKTVSITKQYPHISKIISEPDDGIYDAMNKGINIASGDIICFLNSDDFYENNKVISKVAKVFEEDPSLDACYADLVYVNKFDISKTVRYVKSCEFKESLFSKGWCPPHPTFFARRSVYERFGSFDLNYHIASDVELMMRLLEVQKINARYIPELWIKMRLGGTTNKNLKNVLIQNKEILHALKNHNQSVNWISFFCYKIINRGQQFFKRPKI